MPMSFIYPHGLQIFRKSTLSKSLSFVAMCFTLKRLHDAACMASENNRLYFFENVLAYCSTSRVRGIITILELNTSSSTL